MQTKIIEAIRNRNMLQIVCKGFSRTVEPYLIYESKEGRILLHGWQTEGEYDQTPPPDWCNLRIEDMTTVVILDQKYQSPHPEYKPRSKMFYRVIECTPTPP
jgi:hypothetical protein